MGDTRYLFDNRWDQARRRLALLEELYDPLSIRRLETLGVAAGWRCLEIGAGAGSITRWMSHRVGPSGRVVATDVQTCLLDDLQGDTVEVWCHDVVTEPLRRDLRPLQPGGVGEGETGKNHGRLRGQVL
jgi:23S rRNA U2552 (ribose-2'-O)-methylase RlmE/FtsJ